MLLEDQRMVLLNFLGYEEDEPWLNGERCFLRKDVSCGFKESELPHFYDDYNAIREVEEFIGLHLRENLELRVKWVNTLRDVVARSCPKNKMGNALVSDVDLLMASTEERLETILKVLKLWKVSST